MIWRSKLATYRKYAVNRWTPRKFSVYPAKFQLHSASAPVTEASSSKAEPALSVGSELHNFRVSEIVAVPDFNCRLIRLEHLGTGAQYAHVDRADSNNVFAIAFRTTPFDSTGLPHILEHLSLMGSEKYPCRDPFFKMLNRSLATYINACTAPDFTVYPFATQNRRDYYNLMSVYLDAVFHPMLRELDFRAEAWRLEHEEVTDPASPIVFKGVVFNEMKGVFSENQNIFTECLLNALLPSHTYGVCSGGHPAVIPQLTYENLVAFHRNNYHPSNCRFYSYGNFGVAEHLRFVHENYLRTYDRCPSYATRTAVPPEKRWQTMRRKHVRGKYDPLAADAAKQSTIAIAYLCADVRNVYELFALKVLSQLLTDGPNASFYKSLIEPNIGSGYAPVTGFDAQTRDTTFTVGLQGVAEEDFAKIEKLVDETFEKCATEDFDAANIENVLHGVELSVRHQGADFGLNLLFGVSSLWNHDGDIGASLQTSEHVARFRRHLTDDPSYLRQLVDKYFRCNTHKLVLTMSPDEQYEIQSQRQEDELLQQKLSELSSEQVTQIYETGLQLREEQERQEDVSCLPTLNLRDVGDLSDYPAVVDTRVAGRPLQLCALPTNRVTYFRSLLDVAAVSDEHKSLLPLFVLVAAQMGTKTLDYLAFDRLVYAKTLGLNMGVHVTDDRSQLHCFEESVSLGSLCLDANVADMFDLWRRLFVDVSLTDVDRFKTLVRNVANDTANGVADSAHRYATLYACSRLSAADRRREQFGGLTFVRRMKEVAAGIDDAGPLLADMSAIADEVLGKAPVQMRSALNVSAPQVETAAASYSKFVHNLGNEQQPLPAVDVSAAPNPIEAAADAANSYHFVLPFAVNYTSKATLCLPYTDPDFAPLRVLAKLITTKYLLPVVRERCGAYSAGAALSTSGAWHFYSYRDPNSTNTISVFDEAAAWLRKNEFTDANLDEAKLGVFRDVDAPVAPSEQGMRRFLSGIDDHLFGQHRQQILKVSREDLLRVGQQYLDPDRASARVIIGADGRETESWKKIYSE